MALWSRKDISYCFCSDLSFAHTHCPCFRCAGKAVSRSTEYRHWLEFNAENAGTRDLLASQEPTSSPSSCNQDDHAHQEREGRSEGAEEPALPSVDVTQVNSRDDEGVAGNEEHELTSMETDMEEELVRTESNSSPAAGLITTASPTTSDVSARYVIT